MMILLKHLGGIYLYNINIKRLIGSEDLPMPKQMSNGSSGFDLFAAVNESVTVRPFERKLISTGFSLEMPNGIEAQIRPRSGLALKKGITILNTPGTIDADYRGEVKVLIINLGEEDFIINRGDRIAQLVFMKLPEIELNEVNNISETRRGEGGFGHTGK